MRLETPMIALLVTSLLFGSLFAVFITDLGVTYGADMNLTVFETHNGETSLQDSFDRINETKAEMDNLNEDFQTEEVTDSGSLFGFLKLTWTMGKQMLGSVNILKELLYSFAGILGIPPVFVTTGMLIVLILLILSIVMILAGRTY